MKSKVIFENRFFELLCYSGIVVDTSCRSSTSVSGGGFDYVSIQSQTHETLEFFLVDDEGGEASFKFYDWDFSARVGHHVKVYGLFDKRKNRGEYVMLHNSNFGESTPKYSNIKSVIRNKFMFLSALFILIVLFGLPIFMKYIVIPVIGLLPFVGPFLQKALTPFIVILLISVCIIFKIISYNTFKLIKKALLADING